MHRYYFVLYWEDCLDIFDWYLQCAVVRSQRYANSNSKGCFAKRRLRFWNLCTQKTKVHAHYRMVLGMEKRAEVEKAPEWLIMQYWASDAKSGRGSEGRGAKGRCHCIYLLIPRMWYPSNPSSRKRRELQYQGPRLVCMSGRPARSHYISILQRSGILAMTVPWCWPSQV